MPSVQFSQPRFIFRTATERDLDALVRFRVEFVSLYKTLTVLDRARLAEDTKRDFRNGMLHSKIRFWVACLESVNGEDAVLVSPGQPAPPSLVGNVSTLCNSGKPVVLPEQEPDRILASAGLMPGHGRAELMGVYTEPAWRNHGLASQLVLLVTEECKRLGYSNITLQPTDQSASIYRKAGFLDQGGRMVLPLDRD